ATPASTSSIMSVVPAGPCEIPQYDPAAPRGRKLVSEQAHRDIWRPAGGKTDQNPNGLFRIAPLRHCIAHRFICRQRGKEATDDEFPPPHVIRFPGWSTRPRDELAPFHRLAPTLRIAD